jgi:DNA-binding NarL/FixJ family response regulator
MGYIEREDKKAEHSMILAAVEDLIFLSKIQQTARLAGVEIEVVAPRQVHARLSDPSVRAAIFDLNHRSGSAVDVIRAVKSDGATRQVLIVGFLSHVQGDLAAAARDAGCDMVLARSAFSQQLPQLLRQLAGEDGHTGSDGA